MGDSESSEAPHLPPRCRCGFWGSSKTMNLCSKCFADVQKKQQDVDCPSSSSSTAHTLLSVQKSSEPNTDQSDLTSQEGELHSDPLCSSAKRLCDSDEESVRKKARVSSEDQKQSRRRRCFRCQCKLELVQQELGSCRCGYVFCMRHRLPEQHDCVFDHQGRGRQEAVRKMVKLERKVGRSCQRIGEECS